MFNLLPGQGLGFTGAKLLAFGLGAVVDSEVDIPAPVKIFGGGMGAQAGKVRVTDNAYSRRDDNDIVDILTILFQVIE